LSANESDVSSRPHIGEDFEVLTEKGAARRLPKAFSMEAQECEVLGKHSAFIISFAQKLLFPWSLCRFAPAKYVKTLEK
jgi:hypothetical protein